jgi:hypothetical protein
VIETRSVLRLLRRRRRQLRELGEAEAYARSYGQRSDEVSNIKRVEPVEADVAVEEESQSARLSDRALRDAFLSRLAKRRGP